MSRILVVAAHPDDEILGCGGTVARLVKEGYEAFTLILGEGITSRDKKRDRKTRETEIKQLKEDCLYYQRMKKFQFFHKKERRKFFPELDIIYPYFLKKQRFLIKTENLVQQRMIEMLTGELKVNPVLVVSTDVWRRPVSSSRDLILPLSFKPPLISKYANKGDKLKKEAEKKISRIQDDFLSDEPVITRSEAARKIGELRIVIEKADAEIARLQSIAQVAKQSQETVAAAKKALERLRDINLKTATPQQKADLVAQLGVKIYPSEDFTYIRICFGLNITEPRKVSCYKTSIASPKL